MSGTSPGGRASLRDEPRADKAQLVLHGFAVVLVLAICVHHFRATSAAVCRPHSPPRRASPIKALRPLKPLPPAMSQFSSTRSGPAAGGVASPRLPARSVVLELHGVRKRGPRRRGERRPRVYRGVRAHHRVHQRRDALAVHTPRHHRLPPGARRLEIVHRHADPRPQSPRPSSWNSCHPPDGQAPPSARWSAVPARAWPAHISPRSARLERTVPKGLFQYRTAAPRAVINLGFA